jgi:hypothetical protein
MVERITETLAEASPLTASARLGIHLKENNLTYLVGLLCAMQLGLLEKVTTYGSGICG